MSYPIGHPLHACVGCPHTPQQILDDIPGIPLNAIGKEPYLEIKSSVLQIATEGKLMVRISKDGTIEYGPDYKPDEAAIAFWNAMSYYFPAERRESKVPDGAAFEQMMEAVEAGEVMTITQDGKPVAILINPELLGDLMDEMLQKSTMTLKHNEVRRKNIFEKDGE